MPETAGPSDERRAPGYLLRLWFGVSEPVGPTVYAATGFSLMLVKYGVEALAIWSYTGNFYTPWHFLNPLLSVRVQLVQPAPAWLGWAWFIWTLPFLWVAISMSVRRSADSGGSPWLGLAIVIPIVNLALMLALAFWPGAPRRQRLPTQVPASPVADQAEAKRAAVAIAASLMVGGAMLVISVYLLSSYGASLFLGTPVFMGAVAAYLFNRPDPRGYGASIGLGLTAVLFAGLALLLFALEGVICIVMALPLMMPLGALGGLLGKAIADTTRRPPAELLAAIMVLPVWSGAESLLSESPEHEVLTAVEIDAPPEVVWQHVVSFPDLPEPAEWYFRLGIACPQRAWIDGQGVGAVRRCEFTTGTFVEPITFWEEPRRLAFDVTAQPPPMTELSPYRHVHPPHLNDYLRTSRGEFLLMPLAGGRTRLEGRTWYRFEMFPQWYWTLWSDLVIHRIHLRVLKHIERLAESS